MDEKGDKMKTIKLKNCLLFMTAINSIGSKWGIKEYKKLLEGEDCIKKLTLYIAISYLYYKRGHMATNFRRFANDLSCKNKRTALRFQWDDGTIIKFEEKDFINNVVWKNPDGRVNEYFTSEDKKRNSVPYTPMQFMFDQGFIKGFSGDYSYFEIKHDFGMKKYMKRTLDFLLETNYYKECKEEQRFYFPVLTSIFKKNNIGNNN